MSCPGAHCALSLLSALWQRATIMFPPNSASDVAHGNTLCDGVKLRSTHRTINPSCTARMAVTLRPILYGKLSSAKSAR